MDNMIFTSEVCGVVLIAPFDKISRPPCSTIRFIVFLSLFFRCFSPFSFYHRTFSLTTVCRSCASQLLVCDHCTNQAVVVHAGNALCFCPGCQVCIHYNRVMTHSIPPQISATCIHAMG